MGVHLGRKIFHQGDVAFFEEVFCLDDGREIRFYQIMYKGGTYQINHEVGFCLEQALIELFQQEEDPSVRWESALIGYTLKLKREARH